MEKALFVHFSLKKTRRGPSADLLQSVKRLVPAYAKDIRRSLDAVNSRTSLALEDALGAVLAVAFAGRSESLENALSAATSDGLRK